MFMFFQMRHLKRFRVRVTNLNETFRMAIKAMITIESLTLI